jgi:hypothetical protein
MATQRVSITNTESVVAMLLATARVESFAPRMWPHHRALHQLAATASPESSFAPAARGWSFSLSADGGYALAGLERLFLRLSGAGWLERRDRPAARYHVSTRLRAWGDELRETLSARDRAYLEQAAQGLKAALNTSSK